MHSYSCSNAQHHTSILAYDIYEALHQVASMQLNYNRLDSGYLCEQT